MIEPTDHPERWSADLPSADAETDSDTDSDTDSETDSNADAAFTDPAPADVDEPPLTESQQARLAAIRAIEIETAELEAAEAALRAGLSARARRREASAVYSLRLDPGEVRALEVRAAVYRIKPSVLARNLVRCGLAERPDLRLAEALDGFEAALAELRSAVSRAAREPGFLR